MAEQKHTKEDLRIMQSLPLNLKVRLTEDRVRSWVHEFGEDGVCVSFSGGKDSTVLLHIVRTLYPNVKAVFSNTGLEYPEIQRFVRGFDNTDIIVPEKNFREVVTQYGYPLIGKEVAEAIYYARKLRGGVERNWKRREMQGSRRRKSRSTDLYRQEERRTDGRSWKDGCQEKVGVGTPGSASARTSTIQSTGRTFVSGTQTEGPQRETIPLGQRRDAGEERNSRGGSKTDQGTDEPG